MAAHCQRGDKSNRESANRKLGAEPESCRVAYQIRDRKSYNAARVMKDN